MKPTQHTPCHRHIKVGDLDYTAEQINQLLSLVPFKADRKEVSALLSFTGDNYIGHYPSATLLEPQDRFAWALVGNPAEAIPYFHYVPKDVPRGYKVGWNDMGHAFGTYCLVKNNQEDDIIAEEFMRLKLHLPLLTADRAIADEHGNRIADTYETRQAVRNHIREVYNEQFIENPPLILEEYITPNMLSQDVKDMLSQAGATISNVPDGEDLTTKNGVLKLSDKPYNPGAYSGLGRVYLRKNLVGGQNLLTQAMVSKPNTIYILQYDYTLDGKSITIPEGCVLSYEGGSIRDGHINYTDTLIHGTGRISNVTTSGASRHAALPTDEEDITGANGKNLKFKDKEYAPQDYSGLGRIYLRKNIKTVYSEAAQSNVTINLLEQSMIDKPNTIYIIQYDYDLNGAGITIPEGCVLDFQGGSLSNGKMVFTNTLINTNVNHIFKDIFIDGNINNKNVYLDWFFYKNNDYSQLLQTIIESTNVSNIYFESKYIISNIVINRNDLNLIGVQGNKIKQKAFGYDTSIETVNATTNSIVVATPQLYKKGDIIIVSSGVTDIMVVDKIDNNIIYLKPWRIVRLITDDNQGFEYSHNSGAKIIIQHPVFAVTKSITDMQCIDDKLYQNYVENITFDGINIEGNPESYDTSIPYTTYSTISNDLIFGYRTIGLTIKNCTFQNSISTAISIYGANKDFRMYSNTIKNIGYVLDKSLSPQYRDSSSGVTLHWDQRYTESGSSNNQVSTDYWIHDNTFVHCWNGGIFVSAAKNGSVKNNIIKDFVSHGLVVYGGDDGIGIEHVTVENNIIENGDITNEHPECLGVGIWVAIANYINVLNNHIKDCELGIQLNIVRNSNVQSNNIRDINSAYISFLGNTFDINVFSNILYNTKKIANKIGGVIWFNSDLSGGIKRIGFISNIYSFSSEYTNLHLFKFEKTGGDIKKITIDSEYPVGFGSLFNNFDALSDIVISNCDYSRANITFNGSISKATCINCIFKSTDKSPNNLGLRPPRYNNVDIQTATSGLLSDMIPDGSIGYTYYATDINKMVVNTPTAVRDLQGFSPCKSYGTTEDRPTNVVVSGTQYYDTTLNKPIWWTGTKWVDATGAEV